MAARALLMAVASAAGGAHAAHFPEHSWDHLPVFFHSSVMNLSTFSDADMKIIARFPAVTIEKWQGCASPGCPYAGGDGPCPTQQEATIATAKALKALSPNISIVTWFDSLRIYANRTLNPDAENKAEQYCVRNAVTPFLETHHEYLLLNKSGAPALEGYCHFHVYDHRSQMVRDFWRDACLNMTATGVIDGCGADASQQNGTYFPGVDPSVGADWTNGHHWAVGNATAAVWAQGGVILGKMGWQLGWNTNGVLQEGCDGTNATINTLRAATAQSVADGRPYVYECHSDHGDENAMAAFLIGAGDNHYWGTGPWYTYTGNYTSAWLPDFDRPLGAPVADGVYDLASGAWSRKFASGTRVEFNANTNTGKIAWAA